MILRLSRDVESALKYMQLLNRQQELNIAKSSAIGNVRIIDPAVTQPKAVKPKKTLIVLDWYHFGGMVSIGLIITSYSCAGIESPEQFEDIGINVYASVLLAETFSKVHRNPRNGVEKQKLRKDFFAIDNPAGFAIEAIRGLRTSLHFARRWRLRNNVLMILRRQS